MILLVSINPEEHMNVDHAWIETVIGGAVDRYAAASSPGSTDSLRATVDAANRATVDFLTQRDVPYPDNPILCSLFLSFFVEAAAIAYVAKANTDGRWSEHEAAFGRIWDAIKDLIDAIGGEFIG